MTYTFEYIFIPELVENSNSNDFCLDTVDSLDSFVSLQMNFSEKVPKAMDDFDWKDLIIDKHITQDLEYTFLKFPERQGPIDAKWGIIVKYKDLPYRYFTLEYSYDNPFVLGEMRKKGHINYGCVNKDITKEDFISKALAFAKRKVTF